MLYFNLNTTNFISRTVNGEEFPIGMIQFYFFNNVFSFLSKAEVGYCMSNFLQFADVATLKVEDLFLVSVDEESVKTTTTEICSLMEKAHFIKIPYIEKSLNDMGIHYDFVASIPKEKVDLAWKDYMAENNYQYIEESVGCRNMTLIEKIDFLSHELLNIESRGNQLTIVDPYIFPKKHDSDYEDLFLGVIKKAEVSNVKIITDLSKSQVDLRQSIEEKMPVTMIVYNSPTLHDRWWIIESKKKGLLCGSSLNGIGKGKRATVIPLPESDVIEILSDINTISQKI